jgi:hypothetical protein
VATRLGPGWTLAISGVVVGTMVMLQTTARFGLALPILVATFLVIGVMDPIHDVTQVSLRQMLTPDRLQGRMNSVFRTVFWGAWPVGSVIGGYVGSVFGVVPAILIGGAGFVVFAIAVLFTPLRTARI